MIGSEKKNPSTDWCTLLDSWRRSVDHFTRELSESIDKPFAWNAWDLIGTAYLRDRIETVIQNVTDRTARQQLIELRAIDEDMLAITEPDHGAFFRAMWETRGEHPAYPDAWWWNRIPTQGPVRDHLAEDYPESAPPE